MTIVIVTFTIGHAVAANIPQGLVDESVDYRQPLARLENQIKIFKEPPTGLIVLKNSKTGGAEVLPSYQAHHDLIVKHATKEQVEPAHLIHKTKESIRNRRDVNTIGNDATWAQNISDQIDCNITAHPEQTDNYKCRYIMLVRRLMFCSSYMYVVEDATAGFYQSWFKATPIVFNGGSSVTINDYENGGNAVSGALLGQVQNNNLAIGGGYPVFDSLDISSSSPVHVDLSNLGLLNAEDPIATSVANDLITTGATTCSNDPSSVTNSLYYGQVAASCRVEDLEVFNRNDHSIGLHGDCIANIIDKLTDKPNERLANFSSLMTNDTASFVCANKDNYDGTATTTYADLTCDETISVILGASYFDLTLLGTDQLTQQDCNVELHSPVGQFLGEKVYLGTLIDTAGKQCCGGIQNRNELCNEWVQAQGSTYIVNKNGASWALFYTILCIGLLGWIGFLVTFKIRGRQRTSTITPSKHEKEVNDSMLFTPNPPNYVRGYISA